MFCSHTVLVYFSNTSGGWGLACIRIMRFQWLIREAFSPGVEKKVMQAFRVEKTLVCTRIMAFSLVPENQKVHQPLCQDATDQSAKIMSEIL